ncbi:DUF3857 domain-containing protein [Segetibacter sp.]|jgi:hypothetical protein|uniref:DUF3857 domain-containing protein n=1 Tax=Segetibacter sp. TaxID=2231182 RepID=UPI0026269639|nr:DUF3857 domain-containing protein [Segetibacter sp.]MCW3080567.1 hypothetical protein [Segetibacter sp.]
MRTKILYTLLLSFFVSLCFAGEDNKYAVAKIDPSLLKDASAVKRVEYVRYEIKDPGSAVYYYKTAVTILNENGDKHAGWSEGYDKYTAIRSVDASLYDAEGKKIRSLKNAEISDRTATSESSLADDNRYKSHNFFYKVYPYTVEYEVEIKRNELMFMPSWMPVEDEEYTVESSIFEIVCPLDYNIRYKAFHYDKEPVITGAKEKVYRWEVKNLLAVKDEYAGPEWQKITPTVIAGATNFEIDGFKGNMSNWKEFGKFVYSLKQNRDNLPAAIKTAVHEVADKEPDVKKKIAILYNYMQKNTRYISIQLGIGGWQPFDAAYVAEKKYGDCKALTNYMFSLLKEAGIRSVYTLVKAGTFKRSIVEDFPAQQFNHVILSVPMQKDTVWLECTDQTLPAGYLSGFTSNRYALMVDENGGHLVKTPTYNFNDNLQVRKVSATLDENGKLNADIETQYSGMQQDDLFSMINSYSKKEQLEYLKKEIDLPTYDITSFDYKTIHSQIPAIDEKLNVVAENYAQVSGKRIFIQPNLLSKTTLKLNDAERQNDIDLIYEYRDVDTVEIALPAGFVTEALPQPVAFTNKFGQYKINYKVDGTKVVLTRLFERKAGKFPASDYKELVKMYADMYKADRGKVVVVRKEG